MPKNQEMPNLFIIGAQKCGTTSLHRYLDLHPDISMSKIKEPEFFLRHVPETGVPRITERSRYLNLFEAGTKFRGESSTHYSIYPCNHGVPERIASEVHDARIVYLVRDPIARVASHIRQMVSVRAVDLPVVGGRFEARLWLGDLDDPGNLYVASGRYMTQVHQYLRFFSKDSLLIIDSDDLFTRRDEAVTRVLEFLGLGRVNGGVDLDGISNRGEDLTLKPGVWVWLKGRSSLRRTWRRLPDTTRDRVSGLVGRTLGHTVPLPEIDDDLRIELERIFRPEVEALREFSGQEFASWSI